MRPIYILPFLFLLGFYSCSPKNAGDGIGAPVNLDTLEKKGGVMMQAFYWDVEPRGEWWNIIEEKLESWQELGVDKIWLPPVSKGASGSYSMGYDPMDYFDFGEYEQMGTVKTRFGSRADLESLISTAHQFDIDVIADIVLNHNNGGQQEFNPFRNKNTYTLFQPKSGRFNRNYNDYHPNNLHSKDAEALFFEEQDVCHDQPNVKKWFWESDSSVAKYYKNTMKFDGWRFDYVKGFDPSVIKSWMDAVGGFGVLEVWDGNADYLKDWVEKSGADAFDFANFYNMEKAFDGNDLRRLRDDNALYKMMPDKAVTFVTNHDTEKDDNQSNRIGSAENKLLAYAYILTHPGYPCIFYLDYEEQIPKWKLERLILINRTLASGGLSVLYADSEYYLAQRTGEPGLIVAINNSNMVKGQDVFTQYRNATLYDYSETTAKTIKTDSQGVATIETPPKSYTVWSLKKF